MQPLDATFVDCFLAFINDRKANARKAEARFIAHPYAKRLDDVFKGDKGQDYIALRDLYKPRLEKILTVGSTIEGRDEIAKTLNETQFDGYLILEDLQGKKGLKFVKIGAMIDYQVIRRRIIPRVYPTVSGMQQACEFALMLISNEPHRVKVCRLDTCDKFFNTQTSGQRFFCSRKHAENHEESAKRKRSKSSRKNRAQKNW